MTSATLAQNHYRFRTDTGAVDATPTWGAAQDTPFFPGLETPFRIRFGLQNTGSGSGAGPHIVRISKNGAAYAAVTASSTGGVQSSQLASIVSNDGATIATANFRLTAGAGTANTGTYDTDASAAPAISAGTYTEYEFGLIIKSANVVAGDVLDFEIYNSTTAYSTYTNIPRIIIAEAAGSDFAADQLLGGNGSATANQASVLLTSTAAVAAGKLVVVVVGADNAGTTTGADEGAVTSITDSVGGNTWIKAREYTYSPGSTAQDGSVCSIWYSVLTNALSVGSTITANFSNATARDATTISAKSFTVAAGKIVEVEATNATTGNYAVSVIPAINCTTSNRECLRIRATSGEYGTTTDNVPKHTSGWSPWIRGYGNTGSATTSQMNYVESSISTGTGASSGPISGGQGLGDEVDLYVAFRAVSSGPLQTLTATRYTDTVESFGVPKMGVGLTQTKFTEVADSFGVPVVGRGVRTIVGVKYTDTVESFGVPVVGRGAVGLTTTKYTDTVESFGVPKISRTITGVKYTDTVESFGVPIIGRGAVGLTATKYTDTVESFGVPVVTQTGGGGDVVIYITSGTSFSVPSDCYWAKIVEAIAGGGSGGAGDTSVGARGGGGGGAYSRLNNKPTFTSPGASVTVQIGAGGVGTSGNGLTGGDTWFVVTGLLLAKGGEGGTTGARALGGDQNAGVGDIRWSGGQGGQPSPGNWSGGGGGPGGNFNQFFGGNGNNTTGSVNSGGGGGGGVNGVGTAGSPSTGNGGTGGANRFSVSASFGTSAARNGAGGTDGGGGGGAGSDGTNVGFAFGGLGGDGTEWEATYGIGGGGGGGGYGGGGNNGGLYGGGGGGGGYNPSAATYAGYGKVGVIRFVYTPGSLIATKGLIATRFNNSNANRIYSPTTSGGAEVRIWIVSTASFTVPGDCPVAQKIRCVGGGGGGGRGGAIAGGAGQGGGGGAYAEGQNISLTPGAVLTVNLGVGGITNIPGADGGNTYFGGTDFASSLVFAEAGKGGGYANTGTTGYPGFASNSKGTVKFSGGYGASTSTGKWSGGGGGGAAAFYGSGNDGVYGGGSDNSTQGGGGGGSASGMGPAGSGKNTGVGGVGGSDYNGVAGGAGGTSSSRDGGAGSHGSGGGGSGSDGSSDGVGGAGGAGVELGGGWGSGGGGGGGGAACRGGAGAYLGGGGGGSGFKSVGNPVGGDGGLGIIQFIYVPVSVAQSLTAKRYVHEVNYLIGAEPGNTSELDSAGGVTVQTIIKHSGSYAFKSAGAVATPASIKLP